MKVGVVPARDHARVARSAGTFWAQLGDEVVIWTPEPEWTSDLGGMTADQLAIDERDPLEPSEDLHLVIQLGRLFQQEHPDARVIVDKGRFLVVALDPASARRMPERDEVCYGV